jgi:hypothetical protein
MNVSPTDRSFWQSTRSLSGNRQWVSRSGGDTYWEPQGSRWRHGRRDRSSQLAVGRRGARARRMGSASGATRLLGARHHRSYRLRLPRGADRAGRSGWRHRADRADDHRDGGPAASGGPPGEASRHAPNRLRGPVPSRDGNRQSRRRLAGAGRGAEEQGQAARGVHRHLPFGMGGGQARWRRGTAGGPCGRSSSGGFVSELCASVGGYQRVCVRRFVCTNDPPPETAHRPTLIHGQGQTCP